MKLVNSEMILAKVILLFGMSFAILLQKHAEYQQKLGKVSNIKRSEADSHESL